VRKGEHAISDHRPATGRGARRRLRRGTGETLVLFKTVFVFDRAQVAPLDGITPAELEAPCEPLAGDSHAHLLAPLQTFTESLRFSVRSEHIPGSTGGWCDQKKRRIVVDADQPANARLRTLIQKTIHARGIGENGREPASV
jgi:hypothetical protein